LPLLVRPNSVIPVGDRAARPDYDYLQGVTLRAYAIEDGARLKVAVPSPDGRPGSHFDLSREGRQVTVKPHGATADWRLLLVGETVDSVDGGSFEADSDGSLIVPSSADASVTATLSRG
jgi:alpha-D-xyloside xylohydrolase